MTDGIIRAKLLTEFVDLGDYTTYVFEVLDEKDVAIINSNYVMCVKYPNWNQDTINIDDIGFLHFKEVIAGIDKWYDGKDFVAYKYNNWQFMKFVPIKPKVDNNIILLI